LELYRIQKSPPDANSEIISEFENLGGLSEKYYKFVSGEISSFNFSAK
jgi:hypothetical protein